MKKDPILHIVIIWSQGAEKKQAILDDISASFILLNTFAIRWESSFFLTNLKRFYAHSLREKSTREMEVILNHKIAHCGDGPFTALVFEDEHPKMENRMTSNGMTAVNANVFDKKTLYRKWLGGGHKIHASDTLFETNKDLALLFGCTAASFKERFSSSAETISYTQNIVGVPSFTSVEELFFILNQTINYVVLRNYEALPDDYFVADHGDIDMLVEDKNYVAYLTGAVNNFPDSADRVYHTIRIGDKAVPFDFRFVGDGYYDTQWELAILNERELLPKGFYVPDTVNYFYSLLYHAYIQKRKISPDYKIKLEKIAATIGVSYTAGQPDKDTHMLLRNFMIAKGYSYSLPQDSTVYFNKKFVDQVTPSQKNAERKLVSSTISRTDTTSFLTEVYETKAGFLKIANHPIVTNEIAFLSTLEESVFVPSIISFELRENTAEVLLEKIDGIPLNALVDAPDFWNYTTLKHFVLQLIDILILLADKGIVHRDIRPANILVVKTEKGYAPRLIDFGWSTYATTINETLTPKGLGYTYAYKGDGFCDGYSMGKCIEYLTRNLDFIAPVIKELLLVTPAHFRDSQWLIQQYMVLQEMLQNNVLQPSKKDTMALLAKRYKVNKVMSQIIGASSVKRLKKYFR